MTSISNVFIGGFAVIIIIFAATMFFITASNETSTPINSNRFIELQGKYNATFLALQNESQKNLTNAINSNQSTGTQGSFIISYGGVWTAALLVFDLVTFIPDLLTTTVGTFTFLADPLPALIGYGITAAVSAFLALKVINFFRGTEKL